MSLFAEYAPRSLDTPRLPLPAGLRVRRAEAADVDELAGIAEERHGGGREKHRAGFERELATASPESALWSAIVEDGGSPVVAGFGRARRFRPAADAPPNSAPEGWYLGGVIVAAAWRRRGIATALTRQRLEWIATRAVCAYYFANARNRVSIDLHAAFGFRELTRDFAHPDARFEGGVGILFRAELTTA